MTWAILSTGPSMSQAVADSVCSLPRVVVNLAYKLAPDAEAMAASDGTFWRTYPEAKTEFPGQKFAAWNVGTDVERITGSIAPSSCSGVLALEVAKRLGAERILLLGMDFGCGHFFGQYRGACHRSKPTDFGRHRFQFRQWARANPNVGIINCTPGSGLDLFPIVPLAEAMQAGN